MPHGRPSRADQLRNPTLGLLYFHQTVSRKPPQRLIGQMGVEHVASVGGDIGGGRRRVLRLMGQDEEGTLAALKGIRDPTIKEHRGRIVKTYPEGLLVEFASVVDAVRCAVDVRRALAERSAGVAAKKRIEFRMDINIGDISHRGRRHFRRWCQLSARLEALAEPGGIQVALCAIGYAISSIYRSRIWANTRSSTSPGHCGSAGCRLWFDAGCCRAGGASTAAALGDRWEWLLVSWWLLQLLACSRIPPRLHLHNAN